MQTNFGATLKDWRNRRRMSQLDLGLSADVSARHISFLETGRARPSRSMVMHLCETLQVPRPHRNSLLHAAGFAPAYRRRELGDNEMAQVRAAVEWTLERHNPYPAMALDRHWTLIRANRTAQLLIGAIGLSEGDSLLSLMADTERLAEVFDNWREVAQHMVARLRTESAHLGGDELLERTAVKLAAQLGSEPADGSTVLPAVIAARYRAGGMVLSFFSTLAQFGTAEDIALAELKIELMFPADDATRQALEQMTG